MLGCHVNAHVSATPPFSNEVSNVRTSHNKTAIKAKSVNLQRTLHPLLTEDQHKGPCTVPDKHNQQWRAADASLHPCLDEPYDDQNEQDALKNEPGHPKKSSAT